MAIPLCKVVTLNASFKFQKLQQWLAVFKKRSFSSPGDKDKWSKVLISEMMSSEESRREDSDCDVITVRPLPWRSARVNDFFASLDDNTKVHMSSQAKRQTKVRCTGNPSTRPIPKSMGIPSWGLVPKH